MEQEFYEIAEAGQRLPAPLSSAHIQALALACRMSATTRVLDLACGRGELLNQWAKHYDLKATGVDDRPALIELAQKRSDELDVWSNLNFVVSDLATYVQPFHQYDVVVCLNPLLVGDSIGTVIDNVRPALKDDAGGWLIVGDSYWRKSPPVDVCAAMGIDADFLHHLGALGDAFTQAGGELVEMVLSLPEDGDVYYAQQWRAVLDWLNHHPEYAAADALRGWLHQSRHLYLTYEREYIGWGAFVLRIEAD